MKRLTGILIIIVFFLAHDSFAKSLTVGFFLDKGKLGGSTFYDMTYRGIGKARQHYGVNIILEVPGNNSLEEGMRQLVHKKPDIIIANGIEARKPLETYAKLHPEIYFILNNVAFQGLPNVAATLFKDHEGTFLAGVLAARMTQTKKVAFIGGVDISSIHNFRVGFMAGVKHVDPAIEVVVQYVSRQPDFSGFRNPSKGYDMATTLYKEGVDVILPVAGSSKNGIIEAAKNQKQFVMGTGTDQDFIAKGTILTSVLKRMDIATFNEISKIVNGKFKPGVTIYGLKEGGVGLSPMKYTLDKIPKDVLAELKSIENQIRSGQIQIPRYEPFWLTK